ncbi:unnamed protein product [Rhizoctonia solani]|uniref:Transcription factor domain-containing protein n=1 Tax=Rhizoctonia solani TaxID=456999 RepID=A0A8H3DRL1_9AGAM|nr:unnamed protein product [Rhizoctonia solani]
MPAERATRADVGKRSVMACNLSANHAQRLGTRYHISYYTPPHANPPKCSWSVEGDETSRPVNKQYIEGLRTKIQMLEAELMQLKQSDEHLGAPVAHDTTCVMPGSIGPSGSLSEASIPKMSELPLAQYIHLTPPQSHADPLLNLQDPLPTPPGASMSTPDDIPTQYTYQYIFDIDEAVSPEEQSAEQRASLRCHWDRYLPDLDTQLSRHAHDTIISRCFSYGAAWLLGLLPSLFLRDMLDCLSLNSTRVQGELRHYSPLLHCSLLAFGAPLLDDSEIRAKKTRERFATHAKQWLDQEFIFSNPSLLPSLILLSEYHLGVGEINTGHMYIGMSVRASRAGSLELIVRFTGYVSASPVRNWYHWSTFIQEKLMAHEMQRTGEMPVPTAPIASPIPVELTARSTTGGTVQDLFDRADYAGISIHCFMQSVKLMLVSPSIPSVIQNKSAVIDMNLKLDAWFNSLPDALLIRQRSTLTQPPLLALHIRYWWAILDLYLPFFDGSDQGASQSAKVCARATEKLVKLFGVYDTQFGFRYFPRNLMRAIHTCACGLLLERSQANEGTKRRAIVQDGVDMCVRGLRTLGEIWSGTESLVENLEGLETSSLQWIVDRADG